jgi:lipoate-protein ligase A
MESRPSTLTTLPGYRPEPRAGEPPIFAYDRDDDLLVATQADGRPRVRVHRHLGWTVVLGRGGRPERELHQQQINRDGVSLLRRRGGGCAVVLDPGNVIVSVALPLPGLGEIKTAFAHLSRWLITALADLGLPHLSQRGVSDLALGDRKVGGSCIYRTRGLLYYSTTLLVAPDLDRIERYLPHPPREPEYRQGRSHREFLGHLGHGRREYTPEQLQHALGRRLRPENLPSPLCYPRCYSRCS